MKKILPLIAVFGTSVLLVGCSNQKTNVSQKNSNFKENVETFKESINDYSNINDNLTIKTSLNKYALSLSSSDEEKQNDSMYENNDSLNSLTKGENNEQNVVVDEQDIEKNESTNETVIEGINNVSTLYSISSDIENSCDEFCELKKEIGNAIVETQNLIAKIQNKEIELNAQQRLFLSEQSAQLKTLGRQLSGVTTELAINLSDLNNIMLTRTGGIDNLSLKYLVVLDNLVNGNELLQNGLNSLNLMNQMINLQSEKLPPNNKGHILYGFRQNNEEPIIKDYYINENGDLIENENPKESQDNNNTDTNNTKKTNIDTFKNTNLVSNIDTYGNHYRNIDSFYNTALLDNEFMYGTRGYGYGGGFAPGFANNYAMRGANYNNYQYDNLNRNTMNRVDDESDTQNNHTTDNHQKKEKHFKLSKNVDTYRDLNTPTLKTRLANIKKGMCKLFGKTTDSGERIKNPVFRSNEDLEEK